MHRGGVHRRLRCVPRGSERRRRDVEYPGEHGQIAKSLFDRRGYAGLDVSATYFCILHEWDTLADHISSTQDTPKYTSLLSSVHRFVKLPPLHRDHRDHDHYNHDHDHPLDNSSESPDTNTNSSSPIEMFHVDFSHDPRPAFTAGITEVTSWSWTPNLDVVAEAPSLKPSVHRLLTLLNGRRTGTAVYGTCVEDAERLVVACGWDTLEARSQALQESQSLRETLSHLRAVATETVHLVTLRPFK
ncbi:hypothetical protein BXZ70DRAFT_649981 [Cristinia sonorae]|uniref:Uncharacterized protein n=1 Tax=Cristinia sonorae TaxID=1940300 RepID=A0A8K0XK38_9AGAR|nr:hypothetical protein BXZ70DRAFT_649981 [Cristinia sonorae]